MKNIPAFPILVSILMLLAIPVFAEEKLPENAQKPRYAFTLGTLTGILWGQGDEIVYHGSTPRNSNPFMSRLLWDFKPLVFFGLQLEFSPAYPRNRKGFYGSFTGKMGLPTKTGNIDDFDWLSFTGDYLTNFSRHDASSKISLLLNLTLGYSWVINNVFWVKPYGEFTYSRFSWKSVDGYVQYGSNNPGGNIFIPWQSDFPKIPYSGPAIDYVQNWFTFAPGFAAGFYLLNFFSLEFFFTLSPLNYGKCVDDHLAAGNISTFTDFLYGGWYIHHGAVFRFDLTKRLGFTFSASLLMLKETHGDNYKTVSGINFKNPGIAGGGYSFADLSISVNVTF